MKRSISGSPRTDPGFWMPLQGVARFAEDPTRCVGIVIVEATGWSPSDLAIEASL